MKSAALAFLSIVALSAAVLSAAVLPSCLFCRRGRPKCIGRRGVVAAGQKSGFHETAGPAQDLRISRQSRADPRHGRRLVRRIARVFRFGRRDRRSLFRSAGSEVRADRQRGQSRAAIGRRHSAEPFRARSGFNCHRSPAMCFETPRIMAAEECPTEDSALEPHSDTWTLKPTTRPSITYRANSP